MILISIDALNADALRAYSQDAPEHPNLDAFAEEAVTFQNAFATASWTLPSHASMLTGLYPDVHGAVRPGRRLAGDEPTLASRLQKASFRTAAFTGKGFMSAGYGFSNGFDRFNEQDFSRTVPKALLARDASDEDEAAFGRGERYLRAAADDAEPFFLFLHTYFVHDYFKVRRETTIDESLKPCLSDVPRCPQSDWTELERLYRERVSELDAAIGSLMAVLRETGLDESTLVVLTSDHGEGFDRVRERVHHAGRLHRDQTHVPLLLRGPGLAARVVDDPVSLVDVTPTLLDLAGQPPAGRDGVSLVEHLVGEPAAPRDRRALLAMEYAYRWEAGIRVDTAPTDEGPSMAAVMGARVYYLRDGPDEEMYSARDLEQLDRMEMDAETQRVFRRILKERSRPDGPRGETMEIDDELRDQLRSLGYVR